MLLDGVGVFYLGEYQEFVDFADFDFWYFL
jgi:hypothetical protein